MSTQRTSAVLVREPFTIDRLDRIRDVVRRAATKVGLSLARAERFITAVSEAVANAIQHGGGRGQLELVQLGHTALIARIVDQGPGMPALGPIRRPPATAIGGRGRWIMREYSDRLDYPACPTGTTVELGMNLSTA
ncbi:MAG TPA: ATP-binding protein [Micromonosporaceae bacterium]|jgi:anti-sigma regulatory factor (Ser/Thr protein kinase)